MTAFLSSWFAGQCEGSVMDADCLYGPCIHLFPWKDWALLGCVVVEGGGSLAQALEVAGGIGICGSLRYLSEWILNCESSSTTDSYIAVNNWHEK